MPGDTLHINNKAVAQNTYNPIVIASGISAGWAENPGIGKRPGCPASERLSHGYQESLGFPASGADADTGRKRKSDCEQVLCLRGGNGSFFCERQGASLYTGETLRLDTWIPGGR